MIYHFGGCALDTRLYSVQRGGQSIRLRPKVFQLCLYLLEHRDRVVSREELCAQVWPGRLVNPATLEGVVRSVRKALGDSGRVQGIILTRHSYGYRFVAGVEEDPAGSSDRAAPPSTILPTPPEACRAQEEWGSLDRWEVQQKGQGDDTRAARVLDDRRLMPQRWAWRWRGIRPGRVLAMLALLALGGWGLWHGLPSRATAALDPSRLAVLPFLDLSSDASQARVADDMTQALINQLAQTHGLTVIARTSVMKYKGTPKDLTTIGRELGVGRILLGTVSTADNQLRISAELIDVASQGHLWSQEYGRELTAVSILPSEIALHLAQSLKLHLMVSEKRRVDLRSQVGHARF